MKALPAANPTFFGALKNIGRGIYTRTAKFAGYSAANPGPTRPVGNRLGTNTNSTFAQMQRVGMNFTAEMVTKDNPLASAYLAQRQNYCSSQMIYIPSTPDPGLNKEITQYFHGYDGFGGVLANMGVACSMQDAFMRTADLETPVRGDAGLIWWRESEQDDFRLLEFSADQLGEIYNFTLSKRCSLARNAEGELCEVAGKDCLYYQGRYFRGADCVAYKIYERTESWYGFGRIYAASDVLYFRDPASFRGVRGVTAFANSIAHMQKSEDLLQSALSAAQRQARTYGRVFNEAGEPDEPSYETSDTGRITFFEKIPGAPIEEYYFNGDSAEFAAPNTPSAEVISGIHTAQELACLGLRMPFAFLVNPNAVGGAPSRLEVEKADKEFQRIQNTIHRPHLRTIADVVLLDAMQRGLIVPPRGMTGAQFKQGRWMLPVSPSVDAFYDAKENIDMVRAGLEAPQDIIAETNRNADDVLRKTKEWAVKVQMARQDANRELEAAGYNGDVQSMDIAASTDNPPQQPAQSGEQSNTAAMAEWDESKHSRDEDGKFGSGSGHGGASAEANESSNKAHGDSFSPILHAEAASKHTDAIGHKLARIEAVKKDERLKEADKKKLISGYKKDIKHHQFMADAHSRAAKETDEIQKKAEAKMAEWDESKHPRAKDGEFGSGGGKASPNDSAAKTGENTDKNSGSGKAHGSIAHVDVHEDKTHPEIKRQVVNSIESALKDHPEIASHLKAIRFDSKLTGGARADIVTRSKAEGGGTEIRIAKYHSQRSPEDFEAYDKTNRNKGSDLPYVFDVTPKGVALHELGHVFDDYIISGIGEDDKDNFFNSKTSIPIRSDYAKKNKAEAFAELAQRILSGDANSEDSKWWKDNAEPFLEKSKSGRQKQKKKTATA